MLELLTFRVMDLLGNTISWIESSEQERNSDSVATRVQKRRREAEKRRSRWIETYCQTEPLIIVACNSRGKVLVRRHRYTKK